MHHLKSLMSNLTSNEFSIVTSKKEETEIKSASGFLSFNKRELFFFFTDFSSVYLTIFYPTAMSDAEQKLNNDLMWSVKTGDLQTIRSLLSEVRIIQSVFEHLKNEINWLYVFRIQKKSMNKSVDEYCYITQLIMDMSTCWKNWFVMEQISM